MNCRRARKLLTHERDRRSGADSRLARHLSGCAQCARFAERWGAVRQAIRQRRSPITPGPGFAARVTARLEPPADPIVWAARRLMPATLALSLALGAWCLLSTPAPANLAEQLADGDLLAWVASGSEEGR